MKRLHDNPLLPADAGLSALGLMMRVGGGFGLWASVFLVIGSVSTRSSALVGLAFMLGIARSWAHGRAGHRLQQSAPEATRALGVYFGLVVVHVAALLFVDANRPLAPVINALLLLTSAWPVIALSLLMRPSARRVLKAVRTTRRRIFPEDGGLIGAASLMAVAGVVGSIVITLWCIIAVPFLARAGIFGIIAIALGLVLLGRSTLQALAGIRGLRRFTPARFQADASRYFTASIVTTILLCLLTLVSGLENGIIALVMVIPVGALSMLWPSIIRNVGSVELRPDLDDQDPTISASRDNGVVTLGVVLCAMAGLSGAAAVSPLSGSAGMGMNVAAPLWLSLGFVVITLWAGGECIAMSSRRKLAVCVYIVAAVGSAGYGLIESVMLIEKLPALSGMRGGGVWISVLTSVVALALPTVVGVQALRKGTPRPAELESIF
ncbi:MAG: hypothetical protein ACI9U2_001130 [Bradymonadia bacterium]|jgi:hypothetical protein